MKVVINTDWGGFSLSQECEDKIRDMNHGVSWFDLCDAVHWSGRERTNSTLVELIELDAVRYGGSGARLRVVEIPDDVGWEWFIHDYDGREHVAENHRTWS